MEDRASSDRKDTPSARRAAPILCLLSLSMCR
jgi:hypothetical protein